MILTKIGACRHGVNWGENSRGRSADRLVCCIAGRRPARNRRLGSRHSGTRPATRLSAPRWTGEGVSSQYCRICIQYWEL